MLFTTEDVALAPSKTGWYWERERKIITEDEVRSSPLPLQKTKSFLSQQNAACSLTRRKLALRSSEASPAALVQSHHAAGRVAVANCRE